MDYIGIDIKKDEWDAVHVASSFSGLTLKSSFRLQGATPSEKVSLLRSFVDCNNLKKAKICIAVPGVLKVFDFPSASHANIEKALRFELEKHIPFETADACYCFQTVKNEKDAVSVIASIAVKKKVAELINDFENSGFSHVCVLPRQTSVYNGFSYAMKHGENNAVVVCIDEGDLELEAISQQGPVYSKSVCVSGADNELLAQRLWREVRFARAVFEQSSQKECTVAELYICSEKLPANLYPDLFGTHTVLGETNLGFQPSALAAFGAAIGAAGKGRLNACLHGAISKTPKEKYLGIPALSAAVASLILLLLISYPLKDWTTLRKIDSALSNIEQERKGLQEVTNELNDIDRRISTLERLRGERGSGALEVMRELTELTPDSTWLTDFDYNGLDVYIEGFSDRASTLLLKLEQSKLLKDFEFAGPVIQNNGKERFKIKSKVRKTVQG